MSSCQQRISTYSIYQIKEGTWCEIPKYTRTSTDLLQDQSQPLLHTTRYYVIAKGYAPRTCHLKHHHNGKHFGVCNETFYSYIQNLLLDHVHCFSCIWRVSTPCQRFIWQVLGITSRNYSQNGIICQEAIFFGGIPIASITCALCSPVKSPDFPQGLLTLSSFSIELFFKQIRNGMEVRLG